MQFYRVVGNVFHIRNLPPVLMLYMYLTTDLCWDAMLHLLHDHKPDGYILWAFTYCEMCISRIEYSTARHRSERFCISGPKDLLQCVDNFMFVILNQNNVLFYYGL